MTTKITGDNITDGSVTTDDLNAAAKSSGATDGNAFNIGVLGFKIAVNEGLTIFNLVDGVVDEFNSESGIDTAENVTARYDSSSDFYSNLDGPNPIPSPQASLTQITASGPGTFANEPTTTVVKVFALGGGGAGGGSGYGSGGGGGGGAGGVVLDADVPVTGGASVAINVGAGGEGHFMPNHPSYPNPNVSAPWRPVEWPTYGPFTGGPSGATIPQGGTRSKPGGDTTFGPTITAEGGGGGGHGYTVNESSQDPLFPGLEYTDGAPGGSGGGAGYSEGVVGEGETGENRHPAGDLTQQGFDGGENRPGANYGGGGGGGAGAVGGDAPSGAGGAGGAGIAVGPPNPQLNWFPAGYGHPDGSVGGGGGGGSYAPGAKTEGGTGGGGDGSHYPGPTTTPAANSRGGDGVANTGGGGGSYGGGPSGAYADHRGGLGGSGQLVVLEMETLTSATSSTLISDTFTANSTPSTARLVVFAEISDDLNTDVTASVTRDNTNFDAVTLVDEGYVTGSSGAKIFTGSTPLTGAAPGQPQVQLRWKIVGSNQTAENKIHGVALQWK